MEKYRTKIDFIMFLTLLLLCLLDISALIVFFLFNIWWPALTLSLILLVLIIPQYFFTYYELTDNYLKINFGIFLINYKIPYDQILAISPEFSNAVAPKLSNQSVKVVFLKNKKAHTMYISPAMFETFVNELTDNVLHNAILSEQKMNDKNATNNTTSRIQKAIKNKPSKKVAKATKPKTTAKKVDKTQPTSKKVNTNKKI